MTSSQSNGPLANSLYSQTTGTTSSDAFITLITDRDPTTGDVNYPITKRWLNTNLNKEFILASFSCISGVTTANWINFTGTGTPIEEIIVPSGTSPILPNISGAVTYTSTDGSILINGSGANTINFGVNNVPVSFLPSLFFGNANTGMTFALQEGTYLQIGKLVYVYGNIILSNKGSATGKATIKGTPSLPANSSTITSTISVHMDSGITLDVNFTSLFGFMSTNSLAIQIWEQGSGQTSFQLNETYFSNTTAIEFSGTYLTN